jgi:hypothetical protein
VTHPAHPVLPDALPDAAGAAVVVVEVEPSGATVVDVDFWSAVSAWRISSRACATASW